MIPRKSNEGEMSESGCGHDWRVIVVQGEW